MSVFAQSPPPPSEAATEADVASLAAQCRQLEADIRLQLARCRTVFQLGDIDPAEMRLGWDPNMPDAVVPGWVPRLVDLVAKTNLRARAQPIVQSRLREWPNDRGRGGEYRSYAFIHEGIVHTSFIEMLEDAGYVVSEWTSVPSKSAHALLAGGASQTHILVASQPGTCRSIHINLIHFPDTETYPFPPAAFEGMMTEIQLAYREP